jgi:hypothetical protein
MRPYGMHADRQRFDERAFGKGYFVRQGYDALLGQNDVLAKRSAPSGSAEYLLFRAQIIPPALAQIAMATAVLRFGRHSVAGPARRHGTARFDDDSRKLMS